MAAFGDRAEGEGGVNGCKGRKCVYVCVWRKERGFMGRKVTEEEGRRLWRVLESL